MLFMNGLVVFPGALAYCAVRDVLARRVGVVLELWFLPFARLLLCTRRAIFGHRVVGGCRHGIVCSRAFVCDRSMSFPASFHTLGTCF